MGLHVLRAGRKRLQRSESVPLTMPRMSLKSDDGRSSPALPAEFPARGS
jgi:hypothetical protein